MRSKKSHAMPWFTAALALLLLAACESEKVEVMKSPCAGLEGSPCGPKRPANEWWLHASDDQA
ncbi:MAG: hypothetical protein ACK5ZH_03640 [Alphaproteobacteria bacterium]|jgi:hypothetical protein